MHTAMKKTVGIHQLVEGLKAIDDDDFTCDNVYSFLGENPVDVDSITKYFHWSNENYTRNLVYRDDRFEVMVICWEKGVASRVRSFGPKMLDDGAGRQAERPEFCGRGDG